VFWRLLNVVCVALLILAALLAAPGEQDESQLPTAQAER
jgi:hypothetical protein